MAESHGDLEWLLGSFKVFDRAAKGLFGQQGFWSLIASPSSRRAFARAATSLSPCGNPICHPRSPRANPKLRSS